MGLLKEMALEHTAAIDAEQWPGVARVPSGRLLGLRARHAETDFARACDRAGLVLDAEDPEDLDLKVEYDSLFARIASSGWLGVAESYLAGEWTTPSTDKLVHVLTRLVQCGYSPKTPTAPVAAYEGGEIPQELLALYAGDSVSHQGGIFATGVPTTTRQTIDRQGKLVDGEQHNRRGLPAGAHFVDVTTMTEPQAVDREDLKSAQTRAANWLLDATGVRAGSHCLVFPSSGARAAVEAAGRKATVDLLSADPASLRPLEEFFLLEGAEDSVHCQLIDAPIPGPRQWRGRYDSIISVELFEALTPRQRADYIDTLARLLINGGKAAVQSLVATEHMTPAARSACQVLRAYIWPGLKYPTVADVHNAFEKNGHLRIIGETHTGSHYRESIAQQRSFFSGRLREAAAAGFDPVYRRLWMFQFALREALLQAGMLDSVQFVARHRSRGGQR